MRKKLGDPVRQGDVLATLYTAQEARLDNALAYLKKCFVIRPDKPEPLKLIVDIIR